MVASLRKHFVHPKVWKEVRKNEKKVEYTQIISADQILTRNWLTHFRQLAVLGSSAAET